MKITKFDHSGFLIEKDGRGLVMDPVEYQNKLPEFRNLDVVIVTHLHGDHYQPEVIAKIREANPGVKVFTTADSTELIGEGGVVVKSGDKITAGVFELEFYGEDHAEIVSGQVPCGNIGVMVDGVLANSGDSFAIPPQTPEILLVPVSAPWLKSDETMTFIKAVKPKLAIPTHDALNSELGNTIYDNWIGKACEEAECEYKNIHYGEII
ncbi:MBL fold metallo-hydrolase [Candidatus Saccharibacteria bacterium]|nr:MBL fold metallo-hydrolase [Candidatus Saccharibacteria bacterium]